MLARQIASSDRIVATDPYLGYIVEVSGRDVADIIRSVSSAVGLPRGQTAATAPGCEIQFFGGTNLLAAMPIQLGWFRTDEGEFIESSGALEALQHRAEADNAGRRAWITHFVKEIRERPEFTRIQTWSLDCLGRYSRGEVRTQRSPLGDIEPPDWLEGAIGAIRVPMPGVYVLKNNAGDANCVMFDWHYYGLLVGSNDLKTTFRASYITNVAPGIYAYSLQGQ
jgi:hypothetical protein